MTAISDFEFKVVNQILRLVLQPTPIFYFGYGFLTVAGAVVGKPLSMFARPDSPYISNFVRAVSTPIYKLSIVSASVGAAITILLVGFRWLGDGSLLELYQAIKPVAHALVGGVILGVVVSFPVDWKFLPELARGRGLTDPNKILKKLRRLENYNPLEFVKLKKGCFVGLEYESRKPIYIPWSKINESHIQYLGASGSGKNIGMLLMAFQCVLNKHGLVWIDPKSDYRSPSVIQKAANLAKKNFHFINLNLDQPAQFNLLFGCSEFDIEELFVTGFDLQNAGGDGDFYRGKDQDAALLAGQISVRENASCIPLLFQTCSRVPEIYENENFWRKFKKIASIPCINTTGGLDLQKAILEGDVIYIVGSCDNERVKMLQKMILVRSMQIIKKRNRNVKAAPVFVVLDEFKHLISPIALSGLGVVRDFNCHFAIAHQSIGDLAGSPVVSEKAAFGAVVSNTTLKFVLKNNDIDFAKMMSEAAGQVAVFTNNSTKEIDSSSDFRSSKGGWSESKDFKTPPEIFANLPVPSDRENQPSVSIFFGLDEPKIIFTSPVKVKNSVVAITESAKTADTVSAVLGGVDLI